MLNRQWFGRCVRAWLSRWIRFDGSRCFSDNLTRCNLDLISPFLPVEIPPRIAAIRIVEPSSTVLHQTSRPFFALRESDRPVSLPNSIDNPAITCEHVTIIGNMSRIARWRHRSESCAGCQVGDIQRILWVTHSGWPSGSFRWVSLTASGTSPSVIGNSHERSRNTDTVDGCNRSS